MDENERICRLERENRRVKLACVLALVGLTALVVMGQARPQFQAEIKARKFTLCDADGRARGWVSIDAEGPGISLTDERGRERIVMRVTPAGPVIATIDHIGGRKVGRIFIGETGIGPGITLLDRSGAARLTTSVVDSNQVASLVVTRAGSPTLALGDYPDGGPLISLAQDDKSALIGVFPSGPSMQLYDSISRRRMRWQTP